ncbi:MAG TPA: DUF2625 family protein [Pirellulaceae bacterium]|nr:DUF2625 family protein [Pirellulaceae bacterium]
MRSLDELIDTEEPGILLLQEWLANAQCECEALPPGPTRGDALLTTQVTTRSLLGTVVYETGGVLIDNGWLRFIGSGSPRLTRSLPEWNAGRTVGFCLVADDAVGGFFALNQGALGDDLRSLFYLAPNTLTWESLEIGYTDFLQFALTGDLASFYEDRYWPGWQADMQQLTADHAFFFYPPLWTAEGDVRRSQRGIVPIEESWGTAQDFIRQLEEPD